MICCYQIQWTSLSSSGLTQLTTPLFWRPLFSLLPEHHTRFAFLLLHWLFFPSLLGCICCLSSKGCPVQGSFLTPLSSLCTMSPWVISSTLMALCLQSVCSWLLNFYIHPESMLIYSMVYSTSISAGISNSDLSQTKHKIFPSLILPHSCLSWLFKFLKTKSYESALVLLCILTPHI